MLYTLPVIAVLYDVHGNLAALDAVLADARAQGAERWILGGDYALFGGWPAETVARLRELEPAVWVRGNVDRWAGDPAAAPDDAGIRGAIADCRAAIGNDLADQLGALPFEAELAPSTRIVHASPVSDLRSFSPEPAEDEAELLAGVTHERLLFGHTHIQFRRAAGAVELVNPGSVGVPLDGDPRAAYAAIHPDGALEFRRVEYDTAAAIARLGEAFGDKPWVELISGRLERSRP
jgi:predicted phosphodiesterase